MSEAPKGFRQFACDIGTGWSKPLLGVDDCGQIAALNTYAELLLGWREADVLGRDLHNLLCAPAADFQHDADDCPLTRLRNERDERPIEVWWSDQQGVYLNLGVRRVPMAELDGLSCLFELSHSEREPHTDAALRRLARFADNSPAPIAELAADAAIEYANPAMTELMVRLGFDDAGCPRALPPDIGDLVNFCLQSGETLQGAEANGDDYAFLWHLYPVPDSDPPVVHAYGFDVTHQREIERELQSAAAHAEQAEFSQRRLLEEIEGSFRTRLAAIADRAAGSLVLNDDPHQREGYLQILGDADRLLTRLAQLEEWRNLQETRPALEPTLLDPAHLIEQIIASAAAGRDPLEFSLDVKIVGVLPPKVSIDGVQLRRALLHLLSALAEERTHVALRVSAPAPEDDNATLRITLTDRSGHAAASLATRLLQLPPLGRDAIADAGLDALGLALARFGIEQMGGTLLPVALPESGSGVELQLPVFIPGEY